VNLEEVAIRCALTGGQIRNAAQHAALAALSERAPAIGGDHLKAAILGEYRKAGAISPLQTSSAGTDASPSLKPRGGLESFIAAMK
jgi:hypothetical protein